MERYFFSFFKLITERANIDVPVINKKVLKAPKIGDSWSDAVRNSAVKSSLFKAKTISIPPIRRSSQKRNNQNPSRTDFEDSIVLTPVFSVEVKIPP